MTRRNSEISLEKCFSTAFCCETPLEVSQRGTDSCIGKFKPTGFTCCFSCHPLETLSRQPATLKLPLTFTGSSTFVPTERAGRAEADPSREGEEGPRDPQKGRQRGDEHSHVPQPSRGARPGAFLRPQTRTPPQPAAPQRPHRGHPKRPASARRCPGPEAPAPRRLRPAAPHRYRGGSAGTVPQAASAATLQSSRHSSPSITNLPLSHSLPAPQAGHRPSAEHAGSCSPKPPPSPPSCEEVLRRSNYDSQEAQRRKGR